MQIGVVIFNYIGNNTWWLSLPLYCRFTVQEQIVFRRDLPCQQWNFRSTHQGPQKDEISQHSSDVLPSNIFHPCYMPTFMMYICDLQSWNMKK